MIIKINKEAEAYNCCWYSSKVGKKFDVYSFVNGIYFVTVEGVKGFLVNRNHGDVISRL